MGVNKAQKDKIEITTEMVEAGARVIADQYELTGRSLAEAVARDTFIAMFRLLSGTDVQNPLES